MLQKRPSGLPRAREGCREADKAPGPYKPQGALRSGSPLAARRKPACGRQRFLPGPRRAGAAVKYQKIQ